MALSHFVVLSFVFLAVTAEVTTFRRCSGVNNDRCPISEVRITPCAKKGKCILKHGDTASMSYDFTPQFAASNLKFMISYQNQPLQSLDSNGCLYTSCPTITGASQTLNFELPIAKNFPKGYYPINVKVSNADNETEDVCCYETTIQIK